jgi:SAM-dependent methyltransferase
MPVRSHHRAERHILFALQTPEQRQDWYDTERELAGRLRSAPSREARRRLYGEVYRELAERVPYLPLFTQAQDGLARAATVAPQLRLLRTLVNEQTHFCEIGAGDGAVARSVAPLVASALALDVTDVLAPAVPVAGSFEFRVFDGFDLGLPDGSIDVIYSHDVVEHLHVDDMREQSAAVQRALRPGGVYVCVTPNRLAGPHDVSRGVAEVPEGLHLHEYTVTELAATLRGAGFRKVRVLLTFHGRRLSPMMPAAFVAPLEALLERLPSRPRRRLAHLLAAVKVMATA